MSGKMFFCYHEARFGKNVACETLTDGLAWTGGHEPSLLLSRRARNLVSLASLSLACLSVSLCLFLFLRGQVWGSQR